MDPLEKQQRIDSVRGIVKARWINIAIIVGLGFVLKIGHFGSWGTGFGYFNMVSMAVFAFGYNFIFWLFIHRPAEKIGERSLAIITALQVIIDQIMFTVIYYYTGTVESITFLLYFLTVLIASSLYKTRGIVLTGLLAVFLCSGATFADYYRIIPHIYNFPGKAGWFGDYYMTLVKIVSFIFYMGVAVFFSAFLSDLIRRREKRIQVQRDELVTKTDLLVHQTQELTQTKDYLHEALTKSDKARVELQKTKEELEKANLELKTKIEELEKYGRVTVGREIKMAELKEKIKTLESRVGELEQQIAPQ